METDNVISETAVMMLDVHIDDIAQKSIWEPSFTLRLVRPVLYLKLPYSEAHYNEILFSLYKQKVLHKLKTN